MTPDKGSYEYVGWLLKVIAGNLNDIIEIILDPKTPPVKALNQYRALLKALNNAMVYEYAEALRKEINVKSAPLRHCGKLDLQTCQWLERVKDKYVNYDHEKLAEIVSLIRFLEN